MLIFYNKNLKFLLNIGLDKLGKISYVIFIAFLIIVFLGYLVVEYNDGKKLYHYYYALVCLIYRTI